MKINIRSNKPTIVNNEYSNSYNGGSIDGEQDLKETSEMGEGLKQLTEDKIEKETKMSSIDTKTRLSQTDISAILCIDALVNLHVLPASCLGITRQYKRLAISRGGLGRIEMVNMATGIRKDEVAKSSGFNMNPKSWFTKQDEP